MARHAGPVLMDNCAISGAIRAGVWNMLLGGYAMETVEEVAREAGTLFRKLPEHYELAEGFRRLTIHGVDTLARAELAMRTSGLPLDEGERDLWAHAIGRDDAWILCGPDIASLRAAVRLGLGDRIVSLESLLGGLGVNNKKLSQEQTEKWLRSTMGRLILEERLP
jgi:hypothetical protein